MCSFTKQQGALLICLLIILSSISLLSAMALQNSQLALKMAHNQHKQLLITAKSHETLMHIEQALISSDHTNCMSELNTTINSHMLRDHSWWQTNTTCQLNQYQYKHQYVIEHLAYYPCWQLYIATDQSQADAQSNTIHTGVNYLRISLKTQNKNQKLTKIVQSTVATKANTSKHCDSDKPSHTIMAGRQSWREIN